VLELVIDNHGALTLTENHIRQLHRELLAHSGKDHRHRGASKVVFNDVEAFGPDGLSLGMGFETATPVEKSGQMRILAAGPVENRSRATSIHYSSSRSSTWPSSASISSRAASAGCPGCR